jgi:hypothetical protein
MGTAPSHGYDEVVGQTGERDMSDVLYTLDDEARELLDKMAVWEFTIRGERVSTLVRIVDARRLWNRLDLLVETNTGTRVWASAQTVSTVDLPKPKHSS